MKHYIFGLLALLSVAGFTSCGSDDEANSSALVRELTAQEQAQYRAYLNGSFSGYWAYIDTEEMKENERTKYINTQWTVDMSTGKLTVPFPMKLLTSYLNTDVQNLLKDVADQQLVCNVELPQQEFDEYIQNHYYRYKLLPVDSKLAFSVGDTPVTVNFSSSMNYGGVRYDAIGIAYDGVFACNIMVRDVMIGYTTHAVNQLFLLATDKE